MEFLPLCGCVLVVSCLLPLSLCVVQVIEETHGFWLDLKAGKTDAGKLWTK